MSSKISKKKKSLTEQQKPKQETIRHNQQNTVVRRNVLETLTKWRLITYAWVVFFPPYGLYRIWSKESTFVRSEKVVWTLIVIVYIVRLFSLILFS